ALLFLDRLGNPADVPLIESLAVRLLAGQEARGGWTYQCPPISAEEGRRLTTRVRQTTELVGRRELPKGEGRKAPKDLPPAVQEQLPVPSRAAPQAGLNRADNSNTQSAPLALWVARRQGIPADGALARVEVRFRSTQNPDGGWAYLPNMMPGRMAI